MDQVLSLRNSAIQSVWRKGECNERDPGKECASLTGAVNEIKLAVSYVHLIGNEAVAQRLSKMFFGLEAERKYLQTGSRDEIFVDGEIRSKLLREIRAALPNALNALYT